MLISPFIKIVAIAIVTILAILGLLYDFKTDDGALNNWGQGALALMILSGVTAVLLEAWEHREQINAKKTAEDQQKQQEKMLGNIASGILSIEQPLLPAKFLFSLRIPIKDDHLGDIERHNLFEAADIKALIEGMPTTDSEFRLQIPDGYIDVRDRKPAEAGVYSLSNPIMKTVHEKAEKRYIRLASKQIQQCVNDGTLRKEFLHFPASLDFEVQLDDKGNGELHLRGKIDGFSAVGLIVFDDFVYAYFTTETGQVKSSVERNWGFSDLIGAKISANIGYLILDGISAHPEEVMRRVTFHSFQIISGDGDRCNFSVPDEILNKQVWQKSAKIPFAEPSKALELAFGGQISKAEFEANSHFTS